jgi:DMSO reductase anchor subunit
MASPASREGRRFHELPLVLFSALGIAGGGIGAANLLGVLLAGGDLALARLEAILLSALLVLGVLVSAGHLGQPRRGPLALKGVARSALSNEILALGIALAGGLVAAFLPRGHSLLGAAGLLASLGSVAFLLALGAVYNLPGQLAWRGPVVIYPLVLGTAWGLLLGAGTDGGPAAAATARLLWTALLMDGALVLIRNSGMERVRRVGAPSYSRIFRVRGLLMGARLALSTIATPLSFLSSYWGLAVFALSAALLLDRFGFYGLAVRKTAESEVARVEALL